jgi:regulatory protein
VLTPDQVYLQALRRLTGRDYSVAGIRRKLALLEVSAQDLEDTIMRLQREGWVDDRRYAARFAESALSTGRYYGMRLRMEMRRRGLSADIVDEALSPLLSEQDEISDVRLVAERRYSGFIYKEAGDRDKRKVVGFLQRRGFSYSSIMRALLTGE